MLKKQELKNVCLFKKYAFHKSCMDPIATELTRLKVDFMMESKRHKIYDMSGEDNQFKIFILADEWAQLYRKNAKILCTTGHSMASKGTTLDIKNHDMDYIYVPSQYYKTELLRRGVFPKKEIIVTGYPASDLIFNYQNERVGERRSRILIAPTYNKDLSIMDALMILERDIKLFKSLEEYDILFKVHPVLPKKYPLQMEFCRELSSKYDHVMCVEDTHDDISTSILWADIMIGDSSGALLLGAAGDIPIIAYDNFNRIRSEYYDPTGPEWAFRDKFASIINDETIHDLPGLIKYLLEDDFQKESRQEVVNFLFEHQADAGFQIAKHIQSLL